MANSKVHHFRSNAFRYTNAVNNEGSGEAKKEIPATYMRVYMHIYIYIYIRISLYLFLSLSYLYLSLSPYIYIDIHLYMARVSEGYYMEGTKPLHLQRAWIAKEGQDLCALVLMSSGAYARSSFRPREDGR